jgi:hypothetical protein
MTVSLTAGGSTIHIRTRVPTEADPLTLHPKEQARPNHAIHREPWVLPLKFTLTRGGSDSALFMFHCQLCASRGMKSHKPARLSLLEDKT